MSPKEQPRRSQGLAAMNGAIVLMAILLMLQMWLLSATLESFLAGHKDGVLPAAIVSAFLTLGCWGLYRLLRKIDRSVTNR